MRDAVQLIAYADRLGGSLPALRRLLDGPLTGLFGGVHVLPFFRSFDGADAGFDPEDHTEVDPRLGTWEDVAALARERDVMVDLIVNHVSARAAPFRHWAEHGDASPYRSTFLTYASVFPEGATEADLLRIYRPRPGLPLTPMVVAGHERRLVWTTFTPDQVDLDLRDARAREHLTAVLERLAAAGVRLVRLDAVGYAIKTPGTSCFMTPGTLAFVDDLREEAHALGDLRVLVEVHSHHARQLEVAAHADLVYDFALPPLVLHALGAGDAGPLRRWLDIRPANAVTVLDTHDGIGVIDVGADGDDPALDGLLDAAQIDALVEGIHARSGGASRRATGAAASNLDLYQVNCTFYDALGRDDGRYLLARAIQLFTPGVPQVYYVGLLAGENDLGLLERTGVGRDVNRHRYGEEEVLAALERPVVRAQCDLIRFRNGHPAFAGECAWSATGADRVEIAWRDGEHEAVLRASLAGGACAWSIAWTSGGYDGPAPPGSD